MVDVFVGFLALLLVAVLVQYADLSDRPPGLAPPPAKNDFVRRFRETYAHAGEAVAEGAVPVVEDAGFSELRLRFPASFLFAPCEVKLRPQAVTRLAGLRELLGRFDETIDRVQVTGHTDSDQPSPGSLCYAQGISTNWELSARRSISVLERLAPRSGGGLDPAKVWGAALGEHHPIATGPTKNDKARNRRIEILIRFREGG
jgi:flagellar motor protein MotB